MSNLSTTIKEKSSGAKVASLHKALKLAKIKVKGNDINKQYFGASTRRAIAEYQKREKLPTSGKLSKVLTIFCQKTQRKKQMLGQNPHIP